MRDVSGSPSSLSKVWREDWLGTSLILISTLLLGIWAVKDTIALRNILLFGGAPLSIIYIAAQFKDRTWRSHLTLFDLLPILMLSLMFVWVLVHYIFFSRYPQEQYNELTSTWLRSLLALPLGLATALAVGSRPKSLMILWTGILISFAVLLGQYIPLAIAKGSIFAPDWYGNSYIYWGKVYGVLAGTLMLAGLTGTLLVFWTSSYKSDLHKALSVWLLAMGIALYAYLFVFEARNGIGLAVLILVLALIWIFLSLLRSQGGPMQISNKRLMWVLILVLGLALAFGKIQASKSGGWQTLIADVQIAAQVEKYPNWRDPATLGYPESVPGRPVAGNTYERAAWAVAGVTIFAPENPLGVGILNGSFQRLIEQKYSKPVNILATHSAWVDLTLSYGLPGLFLLAGSLIFIILRAMVLMRELDPFIFIFGATCFLLYLVGEVLVKHGMELLIYCIAMLGGIGISKGNKVEFSPINPYNY